MADIFSQRMALQQNALASLAQALAKMQQQKQADEFFTDRWTSTTPQQTVETDLLGKPIQVVNKGYGGMPVPVNRPVTGQTIRESGTSDLSTNPATLIRALMNSNPEIARRGTAGIQGIQLRQPKYENFAEGSTNVDVNPFSPTKGTVVKGEPKQQKLGQAFSDFLTANASKYENMPDGLQRAYEDFQAMQMGAYQRKQEITTTETGKREEIKSKYRAQKDGRAISSYTSEDGFKITLWRNPDGTIIEIPSNQKVREPQQSAIMQKEEQKLSTLQELSKQVREQAKPEYLGGVVSGIAGQGMGGTLGSVREATGLISDEEAQFRANVASLKNQLLYMRSGAQINEQEFKRLEKELPDPSQPANVFKSRLDAFDKQLEDILRVKGSKPTSAPKKQPKTMNVGGATITVEE